ncbi:MAG: ABC transporter ATP-binding protein [Oenococcus sp.]|uniref:ATP-binding cassette domain-containing protein n=1 Tax=Oenococcus sp. TaxID=1979414 RepID=UPI0039E7BA29
MARFINKRWFALGLFLTVIYAFYIPFNTAWYTYIFVILEHRSFNRVLPFIVIVLLLSLFFVLIDYFSQIVNNKNAAIFSANLKTRTLKSLLLDHSRQASEKVSFILNDLNLVETNYFRQILMMVGLITSLVMTVAFSIRSSWTLTILFLFFAAISQISPSFFRKMIKEKTEAWSQTNQTTTTFLNDLFKNYRTILHYQVISHFVGFGQTKISASENAKKLRDNKIAVSSATVYAAAETFQILPIGIAMYLIIRGQLQISDFVAVQYSATMITNTALQLGQARSSLTSTKDINGKVLKLIHNQQAIDTKNHQKTAGEKYDLSLLKADHLAFKYPGQKKNVWSNINFELKAHEKLLITGPSGIGKSTLLKILVGEIQPSEGTLSYYYQNAPSIHLPQADLFAFVSQDSAIFDGSVYLNLTLGEHFSDQEIQEALRKAGLPDVDPASSVSESGNNFSGGQKTRIELARAFLFDRPILIIDEGTASLDEKTAHDIQERVLASDKTVIEVDHHMPDPLVSQFNKHLQLTTIRDNN